MHRAPVGNMARTEASRRGSIRAVQHSYRVGRARPRTVRVRRLCRRVRSRRLRARRPRLRARARRCTPLTACTCVAWPWRTIHLAYCMLHLAQCMLHVLSSRAAGCMLYVEASYVGARVCVACSRDAARAHVWRAGPLNDLVAAEKGGGGEFKPRRRACAERADEREGERKVAVSCHTAGDTRCADLRAAPTHAHGTPVRSRALSYTAARSGSAVRSSRNRPRPAAPDLKRIETGAAAHRM